MTTAIRSTLHAALLCLAACCLLFLHATTVAAQSAVLRGRITDAADGLPAVGATVYLPVLGLGTASDADGRYELGNLPAVATTVEVRYVGHQSVVRTVDLRTVDTFDVELRESNATLNEVVVMGLTGNVVRREQPAPIAVVAAHELLAASSSNIVAAIARTPGVEHVSTGAGISKPIIRGLGYNRVVTVVDGLRQEGQQWGDEHGIEVDGAAVHSVEVLKGPASLRYGSDAMAGVLVLHDAPTLPVGDVRASVMAEAQSASSLLGTSVSLSGHRALTWDVRYTERAAQAYRTPRDGRIYGSQFAERAASGAVGVARRWGQSRLKLSYYHQTPGIVEGERDEATGHLLKPILDADGYEGEALATHHDLHTYSHPMPYQQVRHTRLVWQNTMLVVGGAVHATIGWQQNHRQEYEEVDAPDEAGLDLRLRTMNYDLHFQSTDRDGWRWAAGASGMVQRSVNRGDEFLIPDYRLSDIGGFVSATLRREPVTWSGGIRVDHRHLHSLALTDDGVVRFSDFGRDFDGVTGSLGASWCVTDDAHLRLNVSRGFRAPNIAELGSNGEHEGTFRYEVGNFRLHSERSWQGDMGVDFSSDHVSLEVALFVNHIDNYIFLRRAAADAPTSAIGGEGDTYVYAQGTARLAGGEVSVDIHPVEPLHFENSLSYVHAVQLHQPADLRYLPMTPAPRWSSELRYDVVRDGRVFNNTFVAVGMDCCLRQDNVRSGDGTETATPSYTLLSFHAGTDLRRHGRTVCSAFVGVDNLTDRDYQSHLSRLKYAPVNPVTGRRGIANPGRNVTFKLVVPIEF